MESFLRKLKFTDTDFIAAKGTLIELDVEEPHSDEEQQSVTPPNQTTLKISLSETGNGNSLPKFETSTVSTIYINSYRKLPSTNVY